LRVSLREKFLATLLACVSTTTLAAQPALPEASVPHGSGLASKKGVPSGEDDAPPLLSTLFQVHSGERVVLDALSPTQERFDALLSDRSTGSSHPLDPALLGLLRQLAAAHPGARIELVSGFRSPKLNEMLRKKGHHVSSHSQHSLGHACDFRIVPYGDERGIEPRVLAREIRKLGWTGGLGTYPMKDDWFVHADVGPTREWVN
jgi:uncharacterized protein YcbK (DUF882 family)